MDAADSLHSYRPLFYFPQHQGKDALYFCGNSLGLQPKSARHFIEQELDDWANLGVEGHTMAHRAWMPYHEFFSEKLARVVGAQPDEVVVMNGLTVNLHLLMISFYRPTRQRYKIVIERGAFPSDKYAVDSQLRLHGYTSEEGLIQLAPREGEETLRTEDIEATLRQEGDRIALVLLSGVNYYTGQLFDLKKIAEVGHEIGAVVGYDLAHAAGNVPLQLHDWGVDFAAWCHYKYLNSGPGATAGAFVHQKHFDNPTLPRLEGWWGHHKATRFKMPDQFQPIHSAEAWQLSNAPVFSMAPLLASLELFDAAGIENLRAKSLQLTGYLAHLLDALESDKIRVITPRNPDERGCQLSIQVRGGDRSLHTHLMEQGIIADWREPDVIRVAPVPLYNSFQDVEQLVDVLKTML